MVLLRVELQELLHADVSEAERVGPVPLITGGVDLQNRMIVMSSEGERGLKMKSKLKISLRLTLILFTMKLMLRMPMKSVP